MKKHRFNLFNIVIIILCVVCTWLCTIHIKGIIADKCNSSAFDKFDFEKAIDLEDRAISLNPNNPLYYANKGCILVMLDSINPSCFIDSMLSPDKFFYLDSAIECFRKAVKIMPNDWLFNMNLSSLLYLNGDVEEAISILEACISDSYVDYSLYVLLGLMYEKTGEDGNASDCYVQSIIRFPAILDSRFMSELVERNMVMADSVVEIVDIRMEVIFFDSGDPIIAAKLGKIKMYEKCYDQADSLFEYALNMLPTLNRPWYYLGCIAEEKNDSVKALKCFRMAANLDPSDILPLRKMSYYDKKYESQLNWMLQYKLSEQSFNLTERYGAKSIGEPYVLSGFEDYINP